jgi:hypothetical protein
MSRRCSVCCLEEHALQISSRIRAGESLAVLAQEFSTSPSAMERHARNHVLRPAKPVAGDLASRLEHLVSRLEEVYASAAARGDVKAVLDSLKQIATLTAQLIELQKKDVSVVENMTPKEQVVYLLSKPGTYGALLDYCVGLVDGMERDAAEMIRKQCERDDACRPKCLTDPAQSTNNVM